MKIVQPKSFTFEAGNRAVLLLHAFTSHSADVRLLGRFLEKKNYTTHAPIYRGHGTEPEDILKTSPQQWWEDVLEGYQHLKDLGYEEIAVAGLSLGGVLSLKLAQTKELKGIVTMATPVYFDNEEKLLQTFLGFAKQYKQFQKKEASVIKEELAYIKEQAPHVIQKLGPFLEDVSSHLDQINIPALIIQPENDELINPDSANAIYEQISSSQKDLKWYKKSGHVVTTGVEKDRLHKEVYAFLESLSWSK